MNNVRRPLGAPRGTRHRSKREESILDAAEVLIAKIGLGSFSIDRVAEQSGFAKGTIYHYFSSRNALIEALLRRSACRAAVAVRQCIEMQSSKGLDEGIKLWIGEIYQYYFNSLKMYGNIIKISSHCPIVISLSSLIRCAGNSNFSDSMSASIFIIGGMRALIEDAIDSDKSDREVMDRINRLFNDFIR